MTMRLIRHEYLFLLAIFAACFFAANLESVSAAPNSSGWSGGMGAKVRLISGNASGHMRLAGVHMVLDKGFTTYWRTPGDSGIAPKFDWSGSENISSVDVLWPAPKRHDLKDDVTNVYEREVIWPLRVHVQNSAKPAQLVLHMSYGVCSDICIPGEARLSFTLDGKAGQDVAGKNLIEGALKKVPEPLPALHEISLRFTGEKKDSLEARLKASGSAPELFVEAPKDLWIGKPVLARQGGWFVYTMPVENGSSLSEGARVRVTLVEENAAYETMLPIAGLPIAGIPIQ